MDRVQVVRQTVDEILRTQPDEETRQWGFVHLYGVATTCVLLAFRRGLDTELSSVAGFLHDISTYKTGDPTDHGRLSAQEANMILLDLGSFDPEEIRTVCTAIARHSDKVERHGEFDELLKDADVLQHVLCRPEVTAKYPWIPRASRKDQAWVSRARRIFRELDLGSNTDSENQTPAFETA